MSLLRFTREPNDTGSEAYCTIPAVEPIPPDAPVTRLARFLLGLVYGLVLLAILAFLAYYLVLCPWFGPTWQARQMALVRLVAEKNFNEVPASVEGRFVAEPLLNGTRVGQGQILGRIEDHQLPLRLDAARHLRQSLETRMLILDGQRTQIDDGDAHTAFALDQEVRDVTQRVHETESEIARLHKLLEQTVIRAPIGGRIHLGMAGKACKAHDTLAFIYPDNAPLLVEIEAPLDLIHQLKKEQRVEVAVATGDGEFTVVAVPIAHTEKSFSVHDNGRKQPQPWGVLQCQPLGDLPSSVYPGLIGKLK